MSDSSRHPDRTLIFVRHAHRDLTAGHELDNGLSEEGHKQAIRIRKRAMKRLERATASLRLLSSERARCRETLEPLAEALNLPIDTHPELVEGEPVERKVAQFLQDFRKAPESVWIACSHGDWLPEAMRLLVGAPIELKKGAWAEIRFRKGVTRLECLLQEP